MTALPYEPPEPPESKNSTRHISGIPRVAYKIVGVIILILLVYWVWKMYTRLPPARPIQYPADYIPTRSPGLPLATRPFNIFQMLEDSFVVSRATRS